ncbi:SGNH/GDSL hydrolase family protein [Cupriavidus plantarum]|uniref:SGNH/GDSL hydrolase family protein n=1 Tax=Cupriavidus plantarum TaxID=942865 RepID=UPI0035C6D95B
MMNDQSAWVTVPVSPSILRGAREIEATARGVLPHRLPAWARGQCDDPQLAMVEAQPAGIRLAFRTTATDIELDVFPRRRVYAGMPPRPVGVYDLLVDGELVRQCSADGGDVVTFDMATGTSSTQAGAVATLAFTQLPARDKRVEIWLPYNEITELVALRVSAPVAPVGNDGRRVWLHHGSSISHGSNADSPTTIWPAVAALQSHVDLINLGLGGSALLDPFTARTMRDTRADLVSVKIGINIVNFDLMRRRAFVPAVHGFLDTIREGHPHTPLLVVSPIYCPIHEHTPGPSLFDTAALAEGRLSFLAGGDAADVAQGKLTLTVIRDVLRGIVAQRAASDPHLYYLDGLALYGEGDMEAMPLPDTLHPDGPTHQRMGERFAAAVFGAGGPFAKAG